MKLLVIDRKRMVVTEVEGWEAADKAAADDSLGAETIEGCVEEYGRCDGMWFTIIPANWEDVAV